MHGDILKMSLVSILYHRIIVATGYFDFDFVCSIGQCTINQAVLILHIIRYHNADWTTSPLSITTTAQQLTSLPSLSWTASTSMPRMPGHSCFVRTLFFPGTLGFDVLFPPFDSNELQQSTQPFHINKFHVHVVSTGICGAMPEGMGMGC